MKHALTDSAEWVELHGDALFRFALPRVNDREVAEDLVQDSFIAAIGARGRFSGNSTERTWMTGILKHKILDHYRKKNREVPESVLAKDENFSLDSLFRQNGSWKTPPREWDTHPEQAMMNSQLGDTLQDCIGRLSERHRQIFTLRELDEVSTEEICKELDLTPTNLWVTMHRCRAQLRKCIEIKWFDKTEDQQ